MKHSEQFDEMVDKKMDELMAGLDPELSDIATPADMRGLDYALLPIAKRMVEVEIEKDLPVICESKEDQNFEAWWNQHQIDSWYGEGAPPENWGGLYKLTSRLAWMARAIKD